VYAVYRVITALILFSSLVDVIHNDFFVVRPPIWRPLMVIHFGYLTHLLLTIDYCLQVSPSLENLVFLEKKLLGFLRVVRF